MVVCAMRLFRSALRMAAVGWLIVFADLEVKR